ncbi:unnamed protein product [Lactuca virosa]|uniref:Retrotransposon Copia-like N-terminal domain-containing protein n=1 Tax=Lactuca virosa TaxID=75947 RepID=A0AAU9PI94_9ASTR|nr:unnamed protein product [Lactuca virosa]
MASSSIHPPPPHALAQIQEDLKYLYASNTNVSNFVSVKLSSDHNYHLWKTQMFSLMETYNLYTLLLPVRWSVRAANEKYVAKLSENRKQKHIEDKVSSEGNITISSEIQTVEEGIKQKGKNKIIRNRKLRQAITEGNWREVESKLSSGKGADTEQIDSDGNTMLHIAVGLRRNRIFREILEFIEELNLPIMRNFDGNTALHTTAIVGNTKATTLLVKKNRRLLEIPDHKGEIPLDKACENMHLDTIEYLLKGANDVDGKSKKMFFPLEDSVSPGVKVGFNLLVNAVTQGRSMGF